MTTEPQRPEIAKRIFDALCRQFPGKYIAMFLPRPQGPSQPEKRFPTVVDDGSE
jgi:hypothetical protein